MGNTQFNLETTIIKAMADNESAIMEGLASVQAADFNQVANAIAFAEIKKMTEEERIVSPFLLRVRLEQNGMSPDKAKAFYEDGDVDYIPYGDEYTDLLKELKLKSKNRQVCEILKKKIETLSGNDTQTEEILTDTMQSLASVVIDSKSSKTFNGSQIVSRIMDRLRMPAVDRLKNAIKTSYSCINNALVGGYRAGELHIVSAQTGAGKTAFTMNLMRDICFLQKTPTLYINSEMLEEQMDYRWASLLTKKENLTYKDMAMRDLDESELNEIAESVAMMESSRDDEIFFEEQDTDLTTRKIKNYVLKYITKGIKVCVIDYIGNISEGSKDQKEYEILFAIVRELKKIAMASGITIIVLAQLTWENKLEGAKKIKNASDSMLTISQYDIEEDKDAEEIREIKNDLIKNELWFDEYEALGNFPINCIIKFEKVRNGAKIKYPFYYRGDKFQFFDAEQTMLLWEEKYKKQYSRRQQDQKIVDGRINAIKRVKETILNKPEEMELPF